MRGGGGRLRDMRGIGLGERGGVCVGDVRGRSPGPLFLYLMWKEGRESRGAGRVE